MKFVCKLNSKTTTLEQILERGKRAKDYGGIGFKGENLRNNDLIEETKKGKDPHHKRKTPLPTLRCYYYRKWGHVRKKCSHFFICQEIGRQA